MEFVLGLGCLAMAALYIVRELQHEDEIELSYKKGYSDGLYENIINMSSHEED